MRIDLTVVSALSREGMSRGSALHDGVASSLAANIKIRKNPGCQAFPFPIEHPGRFGEAAADVVRLLAPAAGDGRSSVISELYHDLACTLQRFSADAVIATAC